MWLINVFFLGLKDGYCFFFEWVGRWYLWKSIRCNGKVWMIRIEGLKSYKKNLIDRFGINIDCFSYYFRFLWGDLIKEEMMEFFKNVEEGNMMFVGMK